MSLDRTHVRRLLAGFNFRELFREHLGWDNPELQTPLLLEADGEAFDLTEVARKAGLVVFTCLGRAGDRLPPYALRRKVETQLARLHHEHLIIYVDRSRTVQVWQWVKRVAGGPSVARQHTYAAGQDGEALVQKLEALEFTLEDETRGPTILDSSGRVRSAFDVEQVTKKFYERFKTEHAAFLKFLGSVPDETLQRWYASVMLNRLMFIYFIQRKGFLDGDRDYLRTRLAASRTAAPDRYYREFLCPLFFEGFALRAEERTPATARLLGQVPYLNGGIFEKHQIEKAHGQAIEIPDTAFERLFTFFDAYQWHLDERPLRDDREINPDVLGYIFEKYVNQKQMGAYYTKEDITGYISQNTVIPYLFDAARRDCRIAFEGEQRMASGQADERMSDGIVWRLLAADPDRYIYPSVRHGADLPLPDDIAAGLDDVSKRDGWNRPAPAKYALPTEIWREVVARRQRYAEVRAKLIASEVHQVADLITHNLDIRQFAQDVIADCEGPELLRAFWKAIESVTILDPTVGSGAFLFAALNVLEPLYEGCLERMQAFVDDLDHFEELHRLEKYSDFRTILARFALHTNRRYFILKTIVVNNLYGVDIMEEAVEICRLRLFLKLVAQVETVEHLEPLPDIDFNVRAGNTLVGYATYEDVKRAVTTATGGQAKIRIEGDGADGQRSLVYADESDAIRRIEQRALDVDRLFDKFRQKQTEPGGQVSAQDKAELHRLLDALDDELNRALALEYGVEPKWTERYATWLKLHRPFHWFVEFYGIMRGDGFSVVIGNPPYVEYSKVKSQYRMQPDLEPFATNLYSACCFRAHILKGKTGYASFVVPVSLPSTDRMQPLRAALMDKHTIHFVSFSTRPSKLFDGAEQRLTIYLQAPSSTTKLYSGGYLKWNAQERATLFSTVYYIEAEALHKRNGIWPKLRGPIHFAIFLKLLTQMSLARSQMLGTGSALYYKNTGIRYFSTVTLRPPKCWINGEATSSSRETILGVRPAFCHTVHALLLSSTFFLYWETLTNCRDLNPADISSYPLPVFPTDYDLLRKLSLAIEEDYTAKGRILRMHNKLTGVVELESLTPAVSKPIIDEIDRVLARHYGFTDAELDFIINYDIKYRMGKDSEEE